MQASTSHADSAHSDSAQELLLLQKRRAALADAANAAHSASPLPRPREVTRTSSGLTAHAVAASVPDLANVVINDVDIARRPFSQARLLPKEESLLWLRAKGLAESRNRAIAGGAGLHARL